MDANNDFFMVNFDIEEDKMKVTLGGSWMIFATIQS